jgi:hypothetical protein
VGQRSVAGAVPKQLLPPVAPLLAGRCLPVLDREPMLVHHHSTIGVNARHPDSSSLVRHGRGSLSGYLESAWMNDGMIPVASPTPISSVI